MSLVPKVSGQDICRGWKEGQLQTCLDLLEAGLL